MDVALQILAVLVLIIVVIMLVFKPRRVAPYHLPAGYQDLLHDYVSFYENLHEAGRIVFEERLEKFLYSVTITGANADVEDLDRVLIGAAAVIPVYFIRDWEYINLREVLLYPGSFNTEYEQHGKDRMIMGMVGTGPLQNVMILSKWELRQGFINRNSSHNTAIHEFVHLIDKMDGTLDGVPELLLERKYVNQWKSLLEETMERIRHGASDIDPYGGTSPVECFAVVAEYFFEKPESFRTNHPELHQMLQRIFVRE